MHLADLFYKIAHHGGSGTSRLHPTTTGYGLAAALLAELMVSGHLDTDGENVIVVSRQPPGNALSHAILDVLTAEPQYHPLKDWLRFFGRTAATDVANRMIRTGEIDVVTERRRFRTQTFYRPVDAGQFEGPYGTLRIALLTQKIATWDFGWCAALSVATGLHHQLLADTNPQAREYLDWIITKQLPPYGRHLIDVTAAIVGGAVIAHR